jgi:CheY-like chemotaxis protein
LIAVTGYGGDADLHRGRRSGFDHYLVKPLDIGVLEKALASSPAKP